MATARKTARKTTAKRTPTPAQLAARERFAEMARAGSFKKATTRKTNPQGRDAGEFRMTVNGKTRTRFFVHATDEWALSYGFPYRLVSNVTDFGAAIKFSKTRATVAIDEAADGRPVTETWEIRALKIYDGERKTNPARKAAGVRGNLAARKWLVVPRVGKYYIEGSFSTEQAAKDYLQTLNAPWNYKVKRAVAERAPRRASNPAMAPSTVYQVQYTKDGKAWAVWGTYDTAEKAKAIAKGGSDSIYPGMWWRVESIKVKA